TGTGSRVSIRDAIRMASHAHHYLTIFDDDGRALYLGRSKRIASADQRIVLIARDRGCSFPSCTRPATWCQAHHVDDWVEGGYTDIDSLTFGCDMHHALVGTGPGKWATTKTGAGHRYPGRTLWHPPSGMDPKRRGLINHAHHPEEVLYPPDQHDDTGDEEPRQPA
ncbi:HNH endonuclease signature motif containing protein, partial [Rhodococcoides fascians]|uniref:HNH endonuclease signature motif containing protein n=1 Tax=Rhodococcoides fascians TaxID=1828 RepID=UPI001E62EF84